MTTPLGAQLEIPPGYANAPQSLSMVEVDEKHTRNLLGAPDNELPIALAAPVVRLENDTQPQIVLNDGQYELTQSSPLPSASLTSLSPLPSLCIYVLPLFFGGGCSNRIQPATKMVDLVRWEATTCS